MTIWLIAAIVVLVGAGGPAAWVGCRGDGLERLVGLQQLGAVVAVAMLVLAQAVGQPSYLIVPLVLVLLSFTGGLVYARLLVPSR